jgi:hypothetical protein
LSNYLLLLIIILVSISFPTHNSIFPFFRILKTNTFLENVGTIPFFVLKVAYIIILNNKVRHMNGMEKMGVHALQMLFGHEMDVTRSEES